MTGNGSWPAGAQPQEARETAAPGGGSVDASRKPHDLDALVEQGVMFCQAGRWSEGAGMFRRILGVRPEHFESLHFLGAICSQQGDHGEALRHIDAALAIDGGSAAAHNSRGNVLAALKRFDEALVSFERAIALDPRSALAFGNRGNAYLELRRFDAAAASYDQAIALDPEDAEPFYNRASALQELGRLDEAVASYERAIALRPDYGECWNNCGVALQGLQRFEEAIARFDQAIALKPDFAEAWNNRGAALRDLKRFEEAVTSYDNAIALKPNYAEAFGFRGHALAQLKRLNEALASYDRAIALNPNDAEVFANRGTVLQDLNRWDEALVSYDQAITLKPDSAGAFNNRGVAQGYFKRFDEALASYDKAVMLQPDYAEAFSNRGLLHLLLGSYKNGWEDYEWRGKIPRVPPSIGSAIWRDQDLTGRHLFVSTEQGLGDTIQFARYLPLLVERKAKVTFLPPPNLIRLLRPLAVGLRIVTSIGELETFDFHCALLDLPLRFKTDLSSIPAKVPYLRAEETLVSRWKQRLGAHGFKIGIAWQGNPQSGADQNRSVPLSQFARLSRVNGVRLINLQKHHGLDQLARLPPEVKIETLGDDFDGGPDAFIDTAAVMETLDLIITSDTSVAHLAGALGRPTWVALRNVPDWRWLLDRSDSPWYPTLRLFRQVEWSCWEPVFAEIEGELRRLANAASAR